MCHDPLTLLPTVLHHNLITDTPVKWEKYSVMNHNCCVYSWIRCLWMSALTSETLTLGCHLITGFPSGPTRNFSKFHLMSLSLMGPQNNLAGSPRRSPTGGQELCVAENSVINE
uniref:Uncharacterized protein n=1 Tax=Gasterosteus aculeatus TaxID=69293 RepID=G3Q346_GASAC